MSVLNNLGALTLSAEDEAHLRRISDLIDKDVPTILRERAEAEERARDAQAERPQGEPPPMAEEDATPAGDDDDPRDDAGEEEGQDAQTAQGA